MSLTDWTQNGRGCIRDMAVIGTLVLICIGAAVVVLAWQWPPVEWRENVALQNGKQVGGAVVYDCLSMPSWQAHSLTPDTYEARTEKAGAEQGDAPPVLSPKTLDKFGDSR